MWQAWAACVADRGWAQRRGEAYEAVRLGRVWPLANAERSELLAERAANAPGIPHRQRERGPLGPPPELDHGRSHGGRLHDGRWRAAGDGPSGCHVDDLVGVLEHAFEPVLRQHYRDGQVVDQA